MFKKLIWNNQDNTTSQGEYWERIAQSYMEKQGAKLLASNFHSRFGEIDLIMQDKGAIAFVEVKYRRNANFGGAIHAVSTKKQQRIVKTATFYLQKRKLNAYNTACRFDVVTIQGSQHAPNITWLKNAFTGVQ